MKYLISVFTLVLTATVAQASVIATLSERNTDVLLTIEGSLDISSFGSALTLSNSIDVNGFLPSNGEVFVETPFESDVDRYEFSGVLTPFGTGAISFGSFDAGGQVAFFRNGSNIQIQLPDAYTSGTKLFGQASVGGDFASLGISTGIFVTALPGNQSLTVVTTPLSAVPLPAGGLLLLSGVAVLTTLRRRKKKVS